jgi:tRNA-specific 2-thiouridylase
MRVLVAMSGGVDSSVAAARLVRDGHEVIGVTLHLWDYPDDGSVRGRCCAPEDVHDARRVADVLGIAHYAFDRRERFLREVVDPFVADYVAGVTPSPCVSCNRGVKMQELMRLCQRLGASAVATGHYARIVREVGTPRLHRARDRSKDQSYFLHMLPVSVLERLVLPLGESTKSEVRAEAQALGLPGAGKGESQELCFVASGHYADFVAERARDRLRPGPIVDGQRGEVGRHAGVHGFTVGQRRNLGVATGQRAYVVEIDAGTGTVRLGGRDELRATGAVVASGILADDVVLPIDCEVAVRYRANPVPARVTARRGGGLEISFEEAVYAVVQGQYAVMYRGERVLGGGLISAPILGDAA